jgi:hypothetical protein
MQHALCGGSLGQSIAGDSGLETHRAYVMLVFRKCEFLRGGGGIKPSHLPVCICTHT